jgi:hypothetical protein
MGSGLDFRKSSLVFESLLLVMLFMVLRCLWLYKAYNLTYDPAQYMNLALNVLNGIGYKICYFYDDGKNIVPTNWFPPGYPLTLIPFFLATGNLFVAELIIHCLIALIEALVVTSIIRNYIASTTGRFLLTAVVALYVGHIDRGGGPDMYFTVTGFWLMWEMFRRIETGQPFGTAKLTAFFFVMLSMVVMKFNAIVIVVVPIGMFLCLGLLYGRWYLKRSEWAALSLSTLAAISFFVWFLFFYGANNGWIEHVGDKLATDPARMSFLDRLYFLLQIDHFWLHIGQRFDYYYKFFYIWLSGGQATNLQLSHFRQIAALLIFLSIIYVIRRRAPFRKSLLQVLFFFTLPQVGLLAFLSVIGEPELGTGGFDGVYWVHISEARFYGHLTFAITLAVLIHSWRHARFVFWPLALLFCLNSARTIFDTKSKLSYLSETYAKMESGTHPDVKGETQRVRSAYFIWHLILCRESRGEKRKPQ